MLRRIEAARARGLDVTANQYPYTRASNGLDACLPLWVREGGLEKMLAAAERPRHSASGSRRTWTIRTPTTWENQWYGSGGGDGVMLSSVLNPTLRKYEGMTLTEIGKAMGKDPRDAVMDLVIADRGESVRHHLDHGRRRRADGAEASAGRRRHRLGRAGRGRPAVGVEVASARVGIVPAHSRPLRPRRAAADARGGDPQDDLEGGRARAPDRSRHAAPRHEGRHHDLRSGDDPRRLDVRGSEALLDRRRARVRQRPARAWPTA